MLYCLHPWTMSTLSGGNRNQRAQNQGSLQGTPQQVLGSGGWKPEPLCCWARLQVLMLGSSFPLSFQLFRARIPLLFHIWKTRVSVLFVSNMAMQILR